MNGARLLLDGLFDDTAYVPSGRRALTDAVARHAAHRRATFGWMVGRLVVPIDALPEVERLVAAEAADAFARPWGISVIGSGNVEEDRQALGEVRDRHQRPDARLIVESIEVPVATRFEVRRLRVLARDGWEVYCEPTADLEPLLDGIAIAGVRATLRAGASDGREEGPRPSADTLAQLLAGCVQRGISLNATGRLQRALTDDHALGYLNLLVAAGVAEASGAAAARAPEVVATLARLLQLTTAPVFTPGGLLEWWDKDGPRTEGPLHDVAASARALLRRIGTSAIDVSAADAIALGLV